MADFKLFYYQGIDRESTPGTAPTGVWTLLETSPKVDFHWYGEQQTKGETNKMAKKLTKTEREYIELFDYIEAQEGVVSLYRDYLNEQQATLNAARQQIRDFEKQHEGERLLKPYTVPVQVSATATIKWYVNNTPVNTIGSTAPSTLDGNYNSATLRYDDPLAK